MKYTEITNEMTHEYLKSEGYPIEKIEVLTGDDGQEKKLFIFVEPLSKMPLVLKAGDLISYTPNDDIKHINVSNELKY